MSEKKVTFGRIFWPSLLAAFTISIIGVFIWLLVIGALISGIGFSTTSEMKIKDKTLLHITLDGEIGEKGSSMFNPSTFTMENTPGLSDILHGLEQAKNDDKIKGLFIEIKNLSCGFATAKEIRDAINDFEESGKFAVAYNSGELVSHLEYYIASAADENYGFPSSNVQFLGLGAELIFFKNTFEKLDIEMQIIRGSGNDFKSAVEPFFRDAMSDSSRLQIERYISEIWKEYRDDVAKDRNTTADELNRIAENALVVNCEDAVKYKLMDATKYRDEVIDLLKKKVGTADGDKLNLLEFSKYAKKKFYQDQVLTKEDKPNVAVIIAEGGISKSGEGLTSDEICKLFKEVRAEKSIKTVVFRINSPGGSALASDEIWREVKLTNEKKKVIVSMGDMAASGGYYIATPASTIFAEPTTITGSIGVFGIIPYTGKMMENKLGFTFDRVTTNRHSILTTNRKLNEEEFALIQKNVDDIYDQFKSRVAEGRGMTKDQVDVIARGRVWTGRDAKKIGLVDELGGLSDAIEFAAEKADIKKLKVLYYPHVKQDKLGEFLEQLKEREDIAINKPNMSLPESLLKYYDQLKKLESYQGIQMVLPYEIDIK
jgi:protease-4